MPVYHHPQNCDWDAYHRPGIGTHLDGPALGIASPYVVSHID